MDSPVSTPATPATAAVKAGPGAAVISAAPAAGTKPSVNPVSAVMAPNASQQKMALQVKSRASAAEAVRAAREARAGAALAVSGTSPVHKDGAPGAPSAEVNPAALAAQAAAVNPTLATVPAPAAAPLNPPASPASVTPATPQTPGTPSSQPPANPLDRSWASLHAAEVKLMEQRKADEQRFVNLKALEERAAKADQLERELREQGPQVLERYNWTREAQARAIIAANGRPTAPSNASAGGPAAIANPVTAQNPGYAASPANSGFTQDTPSPREAALADRVNQLESVILNQQVEATLSAPTFAILKGEKDAKDRVIREMNRAYSLGQRLTLEEASARVQDELVSAVRSRVTDPRFAQVLGLNGSSAVATAPQTATEKQDAPSGGSEEPTTLTSSLSSTAPASTIGRVTSERGRLTRTVDAVRRARQSQVR